MTRKRSDRWQSLRKIADQYEQHAARSLGQSQGNLTQQQLRLQELIRFREEYTRQFQLSGAQGMDGNTMQTYQRFLVQLDQAIEQQRQTVMAAERDCAHKRDNWQDKHMTTRIYDKTLERYQAKEQHQANRKEQRENDDRRVREKSDG